ncbi:MAG: lysine:cadaverine antiporter [Gammaproteobacteria bacterium CG_4_10_14_0_8_um_filter_38_16]|nr:MAG: lysine:cadaverine antiporter [Gammaproteobacteria bacterium CG_4_10_14_0_8_um_filter_38_16]PJA03762.1 MAG: lysine:cadaverine antiporter [Gammaproteobacteria bacterium CG_4_10_14_0_2_um_filter_38_22]PJB10572.1 MAG: lysine:cadaverine antiporter [Gammaproteobacteria bacterium CG_4_9_14_3_um_filter_38_9]
MKTEKMGLVSCTAVVAGNMMGSGIALLPVSLAAIGSITLISWLLASFGALALAFVYAKLAATDPEQGGPVAYAGEIAPILGYQTGVLYFNANWIGNLAVAITGVAYCALFFPVLKQPIPAGITTIAVIWIFTLINLVGAKWVGRLVSITVSLLLIPVVFTGIAGWHWFHVSYFIANWNHSSHGDFHAVFSGTLLCLWSFIGVESASVDATLVHDPQKTVPRATMLGVAVAAIVYFLSCTVISGLFPSKVVMHSSSPFSLVLNYFVGSWAGKLTAAVIAIACLVSLSSWMMLLAEAGVKAAKDGTLPAVFAKKNKRDIPAAGLIIISTAMSLLLLLMLTTADTANQLFQELITIAVLLTILPYFYSALNLIDVAEHPVKHWFALICTLVSMIFCFSAYMGSQDYALVSVLIISLMSFVFYVRKDRSIYEKSMYMQRQIRREK